MATKRSKRNPHDELVGKILEAIENLFSDTSVSQERTMDDLGEIISDCEMKIMAIREDIAMEKR